MRLAKIFVSIFFSIVLLTWFSLNGQLINTANAAYSWTYSFYASDTGTKPLTIDNSKYYYKAVNNGGGWINLFINSYTISVPPLGEAQINIPNGTYDASATYFVDIWVMKKNQNPTTSFTTPAQNGAFHTERRAA